MKERRIYNYLDGNRQQVGASFTVEASLVFSIILLILMCVINGSIYLHDRVSLQSIANQSINHLALVLNKGAHYDLRRVEGLYIEDINSVAVSNDMQNYIVDLAKNKLIGGSIDALEIVCDIENKVIYKKVNLTIELDTQYMLMLGIPINFKVSTSSRIYNAEKFVRAIDFIDDTSSEVLVVKQVKDRYHDLLNKIEVIINEWI